MRTRRRKVKPEALGVNNAADALEISRSRLYEMIRDGDAPRSFLLGRRRLFPVIEIRNWLAARIDAEHADKSNARNAAN